MRQERDRPSAQVAAAAADNLAVRLQPTLFWRESVEKGEGSKSGVKRMAWGERGMWSGFSH